MQKYKKSLQFYDYDQSGKRRIFSFRVENENDALRGLERMNQLSGYFVVRHANSGKVVTNKRIYARKVSIAEPVSLVEKIFSIYH